MSRKPINVNKLDLNNLDKAETVLMSDRLVYFTQVLEAQLTTSLFPYTEVETTSGTIIVEREMVENDDIRPSDILIIESAKKVKNMRFEDFMSDYTPITSCTNLGNRGKKAIRSRWFLDDALDMFNDEMFVR